MAEKLSTYRAKRDFAKTAEPSGEAEAAPGERLRFVIQKHDATRLHYDLRLEHEGVFKSWAVTRGPSLDPQDRRLAVEVEDHPLDYGDFEGVIPKGQYGGGTVMLWDRGYFAPQAGTTIEDGLTKGDLKIVFEGERLHGGWVLVRIKTDRTESKRANWLLIKHRDGTEHEGDQEALLADSETSVASGRTLEAIAAGEPPGPTRFMTSAPGEPGRAPAKRVWNANRGEPEASAEAVAETPSNAKVEPAAKSRPKTSKSAPAQPKGAVGLPDFIEPQLTRSVERPPDGAGWVHEIKFDGYRMQLRVDAGRATLKTRKGIDWSDRFVEIVADGARLGDGVFDGEVVALDDQGAPDFAGLQAALSTGSTRDLVYFIFDVMFDSGEDLRPVPLQDRKTRLKARLDARTIDRLRYVEHFDTGGDAVLKSACSLHLEGVVSKRLDSPYRSGRSETWTKAKCRGGQEVVIAGWTNEGAKPFRSLIAGVYRDGRLMHVGRIGTGYSQTKVAALLPRLATVAADRSPFEGPGAPRGGPGVHWVRPELVAEIESAGWTGDGHLRQAAFKGLREDKPAAEVVAETFAARGETETPEAPSPARAAASVTSPRAGVAVMGVSLSHPDKVLWAAVERSDEISKLQLARYYEAVAPALMDHVGGRPCSIIRAPDGVGGETFFQRHAGQGTSSLLSQVVVSGDRKPYIQIDRPQGLIAAAQTAGVELHPWNCRPGQPETPGRLVFDLDPGPDVAFSDVITAAVEIRERLEGVGLVGFCKTTGGKGLHVVTPLTGDDGVDWPRAKAFARTLSEAMAADSPGRYLTVMAKAKRVGRIFLDYLRNDRMATAVAPFSPRARPGAPVSWPVTWRQVKPGLDPLDFTIHTVPARLKRSKAWDGYDDAARPLSQAIAKLTGGNASSA